MSRLGEFVLRRALADGVRWPGLFIAVNVSPVQMRDPWLVDLVGAVMAETGIAAARVVLEVTEGILIDNPQESADAARGAARARRPHRARRFRHRLFQPELSAEISVRPAQDRSRLRLLARHHGQLRHHHPVDRGARPRARHVGVGGRRSKPTSSACCCVSPAATRCRAFCSRGRARRRRSTRCWRVGAGRRGRGRRWRGDGFCRYFVGWVERSETHHLSGATR